MNECGYFNVHSTAEAQSTAQNQKSKMDILRRNGPGHKPRSQSGEISLTKKVCGHTQTVSNISPPAYRHCRD